MINIPNTKLWRTDFFLKDQLLRALKDWNCIGKPPKKGENTIITWPNGTIPNIAVIELSGMKTTHGKPLYKCTFMVTIKPEKKGL